MAIAFNYSSTAGEYTLTASVTSSATLVQLDSVTGLPSTPFKVVIDPGLATEEIVKVTGVAGTTLTVVRGWDSSLAVAHSALAKVRHMATAEDFRLSRQHEDAVTGVHGVSGTIADTASAQAFTNKDLSSGTNTFPASLATDAELSAHSSATAAHGATGAVVGTTNTQTLTNKDLSSGTNTFPASLATDAELSAHSGATAAHGATGAVVGTTNVQTLTNKTLNAPVITGGVSVTGGVTSDTGAFSGSLTVGGVAVATANDIAGVKKVAGGTITVPNVSAGGGLQTVSITFPVGRFSVAPAVTVTPGNGRLNAAITAVTSTGATVDFNNWTGATPGGNTTAQWTAIEAG